jgi:hypothetical protein
MLKHWFWLLMTAAVVIWYSTITIYVAIRGAKDIRGMLRRLGSMRDSNDTGGGSGHKT